MMRVLMGIAGIWLLGIAGICPAYAQGATTARVGLDQTRILRTREPVGGIAVGNTNIVSVALHDLQTVILTGRSAGETSLTLMDSLGRVIQRTRLIVPVARAGAMTITRKDRTSSYVCDTAACVLRTGQR